MKLIKADDLMADIEATIKNSGCVNHEGEILDCIAYADTIDAVPVVRGRWEHMISPYGELEGFICACGRTSQSADNYCPNCGAKMEDKPCG